MEKEILHSPLDKGESWEDKNKITIEICESTDNRGIKPSVYFALNRKNKILGDVFLTTEDAIEIGNELIKIATSINKMAKVKSK